MVSLRGVQKLGNCLAKHCTLEKSVGSFKCKSKRCLAYMNAKEANTFSSFVHNKECIINCNFNCNVILFALLK